MNCLILMASYNGEKYIRQQIESIINQTFDNWEMIIRDDGSNDGTIEVIREYEKRDERIHVLLNETERHGAYLNFWTLIHEIREKNIQYDCYFFADQDDIWEHDKLETMLNVAENESLHSPLLIYADMRVIDQNNNVLYESLNSVLGIGKMSGYSLFFTHGFLWGCDICVNSELFNTMPLLPLDHQCINIMSHDNYMGKYALLKGKIKYLDKALISHRRHENNTTGGYFMKLNPWKIFKRAIIQIDDLAKVHARVYKQTLIMIEMVRQQENSLPDVAVKIRKAIEYGGIKMDKAMLELGVRRKQCARTFGIYLIAFFSRYKKYIY